MPRLQTRRHFLCRSAALAAGAYGTRAFSNFEHREHAVNQTNFSSGPTPADGIASIITGGVLGHLREVICWSQERPANLDLSRGLQAFRTRGCRLLATPLLALGLEHPTSVYAAGSTPPSEEFPTGIAVRYGFPERDDHTSLVLTWYDGEWAPPYESVDGVPLSASGALFLGQHGQLLEDGISGRRLLLRDGQPPHELPAADLRTGQSPRLSAVHSDLVNATVVAGMASYRVRQSLDWDGSAMFARNCPEANAWIRQVGCV
jgi:hypothetical protein